MDKIFKNSQLTRHHKSQIYFQHPSFRFFILGLVSIHIIITSGLSYGWNALLLILKGEKKYRYLCSDLLSESYCDEEQLYLSGLFTIAYTAQYALGLPIGLLVDYLGPRCMIIGHLVIMSGFVGLAFFEPSSHMAFDYNILFLLLIFSFRYFVATRHYHYANLFPNYFNFANTIISTSTMISGGVFPVMYIIWEYLQIKFQTILLFFIGFQLLFTIFCIIQPTSAIQFGQNIRFNLHKLILEGYYEELPQSLKHVALGLKSPSSQAETSTVFIVGDHSIFIGGNKGYLEADNSTSFSNSLETNKLINTEPYENSTSSFSLASDWSRLSPPQHNNSNNFFSGNQVEKKLLYLEIQSNNQDDPFNKKEYKSQSRMKYIISTIKKDAIQHLRVIFKILFIPTLVFEIWFFMLTLYLQSINSILYEKTGDQEISNFYTLLFTCLIPLGFTGSLFVALLGDLVTPKLMFVALNILGLIFIIINLTAFSYIYFLAFLLYAIIEDILFAAMISSLSALTPVNKFCAVCGLFFTISGITTLIAGKVSSLVISRAIPLNILFLIYLFLGVVTFILILRFKAKILKRNLEIA